MRTKVLWFVAVVILAFAAVFVFTFKFGREKPLPQTAGATLKRGTTAPPRFPRTPLAKRQTATKAADPIAVGSIVGHVFNSDGMPCIDATIAVRFVTGGDMIGARANSNQEPAKVFEGPVDDTGRFLVHRLPAGRYGIVARTAAQVGTASIVVRDVAPLATVVIVVGDASTVGGRALDGSGEAVRGARVSPVCHNGKAMDTALSRMLACESDAEGAFETGPLPPGKYELYASAAGYAPKKTGPIAAGAADIVIVFDNGMPVSGTIVWFDTQEPLGGVTVLARAPDLFGGEERAVSGDDGFFRFEALAPVHYVLDIETQDGAVLIDGPIDLDLRADVPDEVRLEAVVGGAIRGRVYDTATESGVRSLRIVASSRGRFVQSRYSKQTDNSGEFEINGLPKGAYSLTPIGSVGSAYGGNRLARHIVIEAGQEIDGIDFALESSLVVSGTVVDANGAASPFADVAASLAHREPPVPEWQTKADENGTFSMRGFSEGDELVLAAHGAVGVSKWLGPVVVKDGWTKGVLITLESGRDGSIAGKVIDKHGRPVVLKVQAIPSDENFPFIFDSMDTDTNANGEFVFAGLPAGQFALQLVIGSGSVQPVQTIRLADGEHVTGLVLTVDMTESLTITGDVRDSSGRAVSNAYLTAVGYVEGGNAYQRFARSEFDGRFELTGLPDAIFNVRAAAEGFTPADTAIRAGEQNARLVLSLAPRLDGVVLDANSMEPIERFSIAALQPRQPAAHAEFREFINPDGHFSVYSAFRNATLYVRATGHIEASVTAQAGVPVTIELAPGGDGIHGTVVDANGQPVARAFVYAGAGRLYGYENGADSGATTSDDGSFEIANPPAGTTLVSAFHPDFGAGVSEIQSDSDASASVTIRLEQFGSIKGTVTLGGQPAAGVMIIVNSEFRHTRIENTDETGAFVVEQVPPGPASVKLSGLDSYWGASANLDRVVTIEPLKETAADFDL